MGERINTGGNKEFYYSKKDSKRIESEDTHSTRDFKKAYRNWESKKEKERHYTGGAFNFDFDKVSNMLKDKNKSNKFRDHEFGKNRFNGKHKKHSNYNLKSPKIILIGTSIILAFLVLIFFPVDVIETKVISAECQVNTDCDNPSFPICVDEKCISCLTNNDCKEFKVTKQSNFGEKTYSCNYCKENSCLQFPDESYGEEKECLIEKEVILKSFSQYYNSTKTVSAIPLKIELLYNSTLLHSIEKFKEFLNNTFSNKNIKNLTGSVVQKINKIDISVNSLTEKIVQTVNEVIDPEPISDKTKDVEKAILEYANFERNKRGENTLKWDSSLAIIARDHSLDMVENNFFSHDNLMGEDPTARALRHGYNVHKELSGGWFTDGIGENIGTMPTGDVVGMGYISNDADSIGEAHVISWMGSPGHRANMLDPQYDRLGVGCVYDGLYYVCTQNFY